MTDAFVEEGSDRDRGVRCFEARPRPEIHADRHRRRGQEALAPQRVLDRLIRVREHLAQVAPQEFERRALLLFARRDVGGDPLVPQGLQVVVRAVPGIGQHLLWLRAQQLDKYLHENREHHLECPKCHRYVPTARDVAEVLVDLL